MIGLLETAIIGLIIAAIFPWALFGRRLLTTTPRPKAEAKDSSAAAGTGPAAAEAPLSPSGSTP